MSITTQCKTEHFLCPQDRCDQATVDALNAVLPTHPNPSIRFIMFSWEKGPITEALKAAHARGIDVAGLVCYRQSLTPSQRSNLADFWASVPRDRTVLTMSIHGQITHDKVFWTGLHEGTTTTPPIVAGEDWRAAAQRGFPVVGTGSFNWTQVAQNEDNVLSLSADLALAQYLQTLYDALKAYNLQKHPDWQTRDLEQLATLAQPDHLSG